MITPPYGTATYRQIAALLRDDITAGRVTPGQRLPSEATLQQRYGVARLTVRAAVDVLRAEGLAEYKRGRGVVVREQPERADLPVPPGAVVTSRTPTPEERAEYDIAEGVPVLVVEKDGLLEVFPADQWQIRGPAS